MQENNTTHQKYEIAEIEGLDYISTTSEVSGYPKDVFGGIIGFESFEQAEKIVSKYPENDLKIISFERKDGQDLWTRGGSRQSEFENGSENYGDNYAEFSKILEDDFIESELIPLFPNITGYYLGGKISKLIEFVDVEKDKFYDLITAFQTEYDAVEFLTGDSNFTDFDSLFSFLERKNKVFAEIEKLSDLQIVITHEGNYFETIKKKIMRYSHDTRNYVIGLV
jgi:hypothetical protein